MLYIKASAASMAGALAGAWFMHWPVWPVCGLYGPGLALCIVKLGIWAHRVHSLFASRPICSQERIGQQDPDQFVPWSSRSLELLRPEQNGTCVQGELDLCQYLHTGIGPAVVDRMSSAITIISRTVKKLPTAVGNMTMKCHFLVDF